MTKVGDWIRTHRMRRDWSQTELASRIGVASLSITNWEGGKNIPQEANFQRLETIFKVSRPDVTETREDAGDDSETIGDWLRRSRLHNDLTLNELSDAAGVSVGTIVNIEQGRNDNPTRTTLGKLAHALNEVLPGEMIGELERESTIIGLGEVKGFNPLLEGDKKGEWPSKPGVYVLYDKNKRPVYVGETKNIHRRLKEHSGKKWYIEPIIVTASYVEIEDEKMRKQVEDVIIKFLGSYLLINKRQIAEPLAK